MKKIIGPVLLAAMILLCIISWKNILSMNSEEEAAYVSVIEQAEKYESKKIYIDAISSYQEALDMQPDNTEIAYKIADLYNALGEYENYLNALRKAYEMDLSNMETGAILIEAAIANEEFDNAYADAQRALSQGSCTGKWKEKMEAYVVSLRRVVDNVYYLQADEISDFAYPSADTISASVRVGDWYGVVDLDGQFILDAQYDSAGVLGSGYVPVTQDGEYFYVDTSAYRRKVPDFSVKWLGSFAEGYAPFQHGDWNADGTSAECKGLYGYLDTDMNAYAVVYTEAGAFCNGYAPVKKDGVWMLIDDSFEPAFGLTFDEILMDENGYATRYGVFWGKTEGKYYLYDLAGNQLSEGYTEVKPFASYEPCAVKTSNGKWGFLAMDGTIAKEGLYKEAESYSCGYAPIVLDTESDEEFASWSLMDTDGNVVYEGEYIDRMTPLSPYGSFVVEQDDSVRIVWMHLYN